MELFGLGSLDRIVRTPERWLVLSVLFILLLVAVIAMASEPADAEVRGGIRIRYDSAFTAANGVRSGNGTVDDPYIIIDQLSEGLVNSNALDAVRNVYPTTYADIVSVTMEEFADAAANGPVAYPLRIQASLMIGHHLDPTLDPSFIASQQTTSAETAQQAGVLGANFNGAQIDVAQQHVTSTQRIQQK